MTLHLSSLTLSLVLVMPLVAHAGDRAQPHIAKAMEAHKAGDFALALSELQQAYNLEPRPDLLFALGQVNVKLERCADAIPYYEKYLATTPSAQATADTEQAITTCKTQLAAAAPPRHAQIACPRPSAGSRLALAMSLPRPPPIWWPRMPPITAPAIAAGMLALPWSGSTCARSTQQRCSGCPTTARTDVTSASNRRSLLRRLAS